MNKKELTDFVAQTADIPRAKADAAVTAIFAAIGDALQNGGDATFAGFGTFSVTERGARKGRNPQTGEEIEIPAGKSVKFKAGKDLKEKIK